MATRVLLHLSNATNKCIFSNVQLQQTKSQVQNTFKQTRNFRRFRNTEDTVKSPLASVEIQHTGSTNNKILLKGFIFATTFSSATFVGASIFEYERVREETYRRFNRLPFIRPFKTTITGWRAQARNWWHNLTEGQRMFYFICYANVFVFLVWKIPHLQPVMLKYFASNPASSVTCLPMLLSTFSHYNLWHLALNMYVLHSFSTIAVSHLGREQFFAVYLSSGIFSSLASISYKILTNRTGYSLGASGAIMGILSFICIQYPETKLNIILLPQFTFGAGTAIKSMLAFDAIGCILRWQFFDHAAHLGGAFFGLFWQYLGVSNIWRRRNIVLEYWHEFRNPPKSH